MRAEEIPFSRLAAQQISGTKFTKVKDLVKHMGALQAQDYMMAKRAIGLRLKNADEKLVDDAIIKGEIIRTHVLRATWHFVAADDLMWMLGLTGKRIRTSLSGRHKRLGLTASVLEKSRKIITEALSKNNHLSRNELVNLLKEAGIKTDLNRVSHIFAEAELSGLICSGVPDGNKHTYALTSERVRSSPAISREEALARLARIYYKSRGPASVNDFSWWSGLNLTDSRTALELIKDEMQSVTYGSNTLWHTGDHNGDEKDDNLYLLPAFDEFLIGYTDRSAVISRANAKNYVTLNGIFFPIIVYKGQVTGTWKRIIKKDTVKVEFNFFGNATKKARKRAELEAEKLAEFIGKKTV